jgi:ssDNA-binding replication factor A large subunit
MQSSSSMSSLSSNNNSNNGSNVQSTSSSRFYSVKDLELNMKNINLNVIVLDVAKPTLTKDGHEVRNVRIADKTGSVNLSVWNEIGAVLRESDILRLTGCFTQIWKNSLQVKIGNKGGLTKCGEFMMIFNETPDMSILTPEVMKSIQEQQQQTK